MEIGEEGIDYGNILAASELDSARGVIMRCAMQPHAVEYEVIGGSAGF